MSKRITGVGEAVRYEASNRQQACVPSVPKRQMNHEEAQRPRILVDANFMLVFITFRDGTTCLTTGGILMKDSIRDIVFISG